MCPEDSAALDALVEAGFEVSAVAPEHRERATRLAGLFGLLGMAPPAGPAAPNTLQRDAERQRARRSAVEALASTHEPFVRLTAPDADALDALVEAGWQADEVPQGFRVRAARVVDLLGLLDITGAEPSTADLADRTFHLVTLERARARKTAERAAASGLGVRARSIGLRDILSAAAMILVGVSVLWPLLAAAREGQRTQACQSRMQSAGLGFTAYGADHQGYLPAVDRRGTRRGPWWNVGEDASSHSIDLFLLARNDYASVGHLACPGNPMAPIDLNTDSCSDWRTYDELSYSYQLPGARPARWQGARTFVVLADKSPVVARARLGERADPSLRSVNHRGRGQNVLFSDGSVRWYVSPSLENGDHLWLPASIDAAAPGGARLTGGERPAHEGDAFVGP
jgi:hypothetical protein